MKRTATALTLIIALLVVSVVTEAAEMPSAIENSWTTKNSMPSTLSHIKATVLNSKIYVVGVHLGENTCNSLYEYDPTTDVWVAKASLPSSRDYFAMVTCQDTIYVIGGGSNPQESYAPDSLSTNEAYDPTTDTWETKASMPTSRWGMVANAVNDKIYVISGRTGGGQTSVDVNEVYDPNTNSWTSASPIPVPVCGPESAVIDNRIYVIGGQADYNSPMNPGLNQIYVPENDIWIQGAKEPNPEWASAAAGATTGVMAPKMIYVMGGWESFVDILDQNYAYNPKEDNWTIAASLPSASAACTIAVVNDLLYVIGGARNARLTTDVFQYVPLGYGKTAETIAEPFPTALVITASGASVAMVGVGLLVYFKKRRRGVV
jgi:N-acetylneuraminic acid mutarotase